MTKKPKTKKKAGKKASKGVSGMMKARGMTRAQAEAAMAKMGMNQMMPMMKTGKKRAPKKRKGK